MKNFIKVSKLLQSWTQVVGTLEPDHVSPFPLINVGKYRVSSTKKRKNHPIINIVSGGRGELARCSNELETQGTREQGTKKPDNLGTREPRN